jgi:hypothetical protein
VSERVIARRVTSFFTMSCVNKTVKSTIIRSTTIKPKTASALLLAAVARLRG